MADTKLPAPEAPAKQTREAPTFAPIEGEPPAQAARAASGGWKSEFIKNVRENPGKWFKISEVSPSVVSHLKKADPELEVESRGSHFVEGRKTRLADVYARYTPAGKAPAAPKS